MSEIKELSKMRKSHPKFKDFKNVLNDIPKEASAASPPELKKVKQMVQHAALSHLCMSLPSSGLRSSLNIALHHARSTSASGLMMPLFCRMLWLPATLSS
jgi:hypothetical protein